jgi:hypothetical protein
MTANELISYVADLVNQSSDEAKERIGRSLNVRYKQVTSAIGLASTRREEIPAVATIGSRYMTFTGVEKLENVFRRVGTKVYILDELTNDELLDTNIRTEPPHAYTVYSVAPTSVTIKLDCTPTTGFTLYATALQDASSISNTDVPNFPESYHDVLVQGVMADELSRKEKFDQAMVCEKKFESRLSDLRMFVAKTAYLSLYRGKHADAEGWWDYAGINRK